MTAQEGCRVGSREQWFDGISGARVWIHSPQGTVRLPGTALAPGAWHVLGRHIVAIFSLQDG